MCEVSTLEQLELILDSGGCLGPLLSMGLLGPPHNMEWMDSKELRQLSAMVTNPLR